MRGDSLAQGLEGAQDNKFNGFHVPSTCAGTTERYRILGVALGNLIWSGKALSTP